MVSEEPPIPPGAPAAGPADEVADLVRVGRVGTGRRLEPAPEAAVESIRHFARTRYIPGLGTLLEVARRHAAGGGEAGLGVEAFSEIRRQLGALVEHLESVAIHVGPVLFLKTRARNQPGTALRWLHDEEHRALREHPELLDQPARLAAQLKKRVAEAAAAARAAEEAGPPEPDAGTA